MATFVHTLGRLTATVLEPRSWCLGPHLVICCALQAPCLQRLAYSALLTGVCVVLFDECRRSPTLVLALRPNRSSSKRAPLAAAAGAPAGSAAAAGASAAGAVVADADKAAAAGTGSEAGAKPAGAAAMAVDVSSSSLLQPLGLGVAAVALPMQVGVPGSYL